MESEKIEEWIGKDVKIETVSGWFYKGKVVGSTHDFIVFRDIFDKLTMINFSSIVLIKEVSK